MGLVRVALVVLMAAVWGQVTLQQPPPDGRQVPASQTGLAREAHDLYRAEQWALAAEKYEAALAAAPELVVAHFYLGNCYDRIYNPYRAGDAQNGALIGKAVRHYEIAAERDPDPAIRKLAWEYLASAYGPGKLNDPVKAKAAMQRAAAVSGTARAPAGEFPLALVDGVVPLRSRADRPIRKTKNVNPVYPEEARRANVQGTVIIDVVIDKKGRVSQARVVRSIPMLDQPALDAVKQWEFTPATHNGEPWPIVMTVTVGFRR